VPGRAGCVMLRSIGAARGAVLVAAGAENVRPPRLPELPELRASAETTVKTSAAATASSASNGRRVFMVLPLWGSQARAFSTALYRDLTAPREGVLHNGARKTDYDHFGDF